MIDERVPTEHLEAADAQLEGAHREALQQLMAIAGPFLLGVVGVLAVRKKRKEIRAELAARAEASVRQNGDVRDDRERPPSSEQASRAIAEELPGWAHLAEIDGRLVVVDNESGHLVCTVLDPVDLVASGQLTEWCDRLRRTSGG